MGEPHIMEGVINIVIVILVVVCIWIYILWKNSRKMNESIRQIAQQHNLVRNDQSARTLCRALHILNPNITAGVDYILRHDDPEQAPYIAEWLTDAPRPGAEEIKSAILEIQDAHHDDKYAALRRAEYPSVGTQLDAAYQARQGNTARQIEVDEEIRAVKEKYPKTDDCI